MEFKNIQHFKESLKDKPNTHETVEQNVDEKTIEKDIYNDGQFGSNIFGCSFLIITLVVISFIIHKTNSYRK